MLEIPSINIPDLWQQEAVHHLRDGHDVIIDAPTGAGKTRIFELFAKELGKGEQAVYTVPTRALANDKRAEWTAAGMRVGIATGDIAEDTEAPILVATMEAQAPRIAAGDGPRLLVIDEYQMLSHPTRGTTYESSIALAPKETQLLLLSGSVANTEDVLRWFEKIGRSAHIVEVNERPVPLGEIPARALPYQPPNAISGFWPRFAGATLMADLGPLLIFAPRRLEAEKIARKIAGALPCENPLELTNEQSAACGKNLSRVLASRVAYHHSGLPYAVRAGVVEPLAKAGQLRVIVATTGLAAGINFSVRSVHVAAGSLFDGEQERPLQPDELLQMFGRAGRRGLDEEGTAVVSDNSPRLYDAAPVRLGRSAPLDWPTIIRAMGSAPVRGQAPFEVARELVANLFTQGAVHLGLRGSAEDTPSYPTIHESGGFQIAPQEEQIENSQGEWEAVSLGKPTETTLGQAFTWHRDRLKPALQVARIPEALPLQIGRLCKSKNLDSWLYAREVTIGTGGDAGFRASKKLAKLLGISGKVVERRDLEARWESHLRSLTPETSTKTYALRETSLIAEIDLTRFPVTCHRDQHGVELAEPQRRSIDRPIESAVIDPTTGDLANAAPGSPAYIWRELGLIEADGTPTQRGEIFSRFQGGEGLAITAALEDPSYPVDEIAVHLANLRAGFRNDDEPEGSERLGAACRATFGLRDFPGYLQIGLPPDYGEGAAEILAEKLAKRPIKKDNAPSPGDIERALVEWISLLRHIQNAPPHPWDRWGELQTAARQILHELGGRSPSHHLPEVPAEQVVKKPRHKLYFRR